MATRSRGIAKSAEDLKRAAMLRFFVLVAVLSSVVIGLDTIARAIPSSIN